MHILGLNPWIYDFSAYDFWAKPLGLLSLLAYAYKAGSKISFYDCLNRFHPAVISPNSRTKLNHKGGTGHFYYEIIPKPEPLKWVLRHFRRYGTPLAIVHNDLKKLSTPDIIFISSGMTYWYLGIIELVKLVKDIWPNIPLFLGGTYATLCTEHARKNLPEVTIISGPGEPLIRKIMGIEDNTQPDLATPGSPKNFAFSMQAIIPFVYELSYLPILTSRGCPKNCYYCASKIIFPAFIQRPIKEVIEEIIEAQKKYNIKNFAFYDDALLVHPQKHIKKIFSQIIQANLDINIYTPNGVHAEYIDLEMAHLMKKAGVKNIRLSLETTDINLVQQWGRNDVQKYVAEAIKNLLQAGFNNKDIGIYILMGVPGQNHRQLEATIDWVLKFKIRPHLAEYSPIPGTTLWPQAVKLSQVDITNEPLYHNNTVFYQTLPGWDIDYYRQLKNQINQALTW